ncbi:hypothetical protein [Rhizobium leguminosarum]|nr:hypothetical protein [Rhizobium leguminosarum]MBY5405510.1 hypothetical protein [Rhizobium leguminosarum]
MLSNPVQFPVARFRTVVDATVAFRQCHRPDRGIVEVNPAPLRLVVW